MLDTFLVWVTGILMTWILQPYLSGENSLRTLTAIRAFRLLRLLRVVRHSELFSDMWTIMKGLADSTKSLFGTICVIVFVNYLFGIVAVNLIGDAPQFTGTPAEESQVFFS